MTYYTSDDWDLVPQSITETEVGTWDYVSQSFSDALREGPVGSFIRISNIGNALNDESSPMISKDEADSILKEYGITNIKISNEGVTTRYMDLVVEQTKNRLEREQLYQRAPDGAIANTAGFTASLAGSILDPSNLILMAIPVVGEVRGGTLLARTGQRFAQGFAAGGIQSAALQPLTTQAAAMEGENYTNLQALTNITFGALAGGSIVSIGGALGEGIGRLKAYRARVRNKGTELETPRTLADDVNIIDNNNIRPDELVTTPLDNVNAHVAEYHGRVANDMAFNEVINTSTIDLEYNAARQLTGAEQRAIRTEINDINYQLREDNLSRMMRDLTDEYHTNTVSGRKAKSQAKKEVEAFKQDLQDQLADLQQQLEAHKLANQSINDLNQIRKGKLPERLKKEFERRKQEIYNTIKDNEIPQFTAIERINSADYVVRNNALKASIAQAMEGKLLDIEPFFDLSDPLKRQDAIRKLADNSVKLDSKTTNLLNQMDTELRNTSKLTDYQQAVDNLNYQYEMAAAKAKQSNQDSVAKALDDAMNYANDDTVSKASKAYALCRIGR